MNREHYIYMHINIDNNEIFYVGLGKGQRAYIKSGRGKFWKTYTSKYPNYQIVICENNLTIEESIDLEIKYIKDIGRRDLNLGTLVNLTNGGDGTNGYKHTNETKLIISQKSKGNKYNTGRIASKETRIKNAESARNRVWSDSSRNKISFNKMGNQYMLGKKHSDETIDKIKNSQKSKKVLMFDLDNIFIKEYNSINECARDNNTSATEISKVCNGFRKKHINRFFKFKE